MKDDLLHENLKRVDEPAIVVTALRILAEKGLMSDIPEIMSLSRNVNPQIQTAAITTAVSIIRTQLTRNFDRLDETMRRKLVQLLESMHPGVVEEISRDIFSAEESDRMRAIQILALFRKNPRIRDIVARLVADKDVKIRATAVHILGDMIGPTEQHMVMSLLNDKDKRVRANTIEALESVGNPKMLPLLMRLRKDPNNRIRGNVLKALHTLGYKSIESDLIEMINADNDNMKASGLWVIARTLTSNRDIEDAAGKALISQSEMVNGNARKALQGIGTKRALGYLLYLDENETVTAVSETR